MRLFRFETVRDWLGSLLIEVRFIYSSKAPTRRLVHIIPKICQ